MTTERLSKVQKKLLLYLLEHPTHKYKEYWRFLKKWITSTHHVHRSELLWQVFLIEEFNAAMKSDEYSESYPFRYRKKYVKKNRDGSYKIYKHKAPKGYMAAQVTLTRALHTLYRKGWIQTYGYDGKPTNKSQLIDELKHILGHKARLKKDYEKEYNRLDTGPLEVLKVVAAFGKTPTQADIDAASKESDEATKGFTMAKHKAALVARLTALQQPAKDLDISGRYDAIELTAAGKAKAKQILNAK